MFDKGGEYTTSLFSNILSELPDLLSELKIVEQKGWDEREGPDVPDSNVPAWEMYNGLVVGAPNKG